MILPSRFHLLRLVLAGLIAGSAFPVHAADQHWNRISSDHFEVLTDAPPKKAQEIAARFEQMRAVFAQLLVRKQVRMSEPIEIIALADPVKYAQLASPANANAPGLWLPGEDRVFGVLNAADPDCWRNVEYPLARYFLNYNYPPTQPWFDEGFAEYFSSLYFTPQKTELGNDPNTTTPTASSAATGSGNLKPLTEVLNQSSWMNLADLLQKQSPSNGQERMHDPLFSAQSWILVHYLINKDKLSETGTYFGLVELQKIPITQAIQQAFGIPVAQLDEAVKDYFHSLKPPARSVLPVKKTNTPPQPQSVNESQIPLSVDDVGTTVKQVAIPEALALVDEMELRIPEKRQQASQELEKLASEERTDTVVAHRALAWAHIQKGETKESFEELSSAMQINSSDPWTRFEIALASYHSGEKGAKVQGLANMMESLQIVIDRHPEFAEAYNMLGWARLAGGGSNAAVEAMKMAVQFAPRSEPYQLRLAEAYLAARKWDPASALLDRLSGSQDPQIVAGTKKDLHDLPYLKKFGIPPQEETPPKQEADAQAGVNAQKSSQANKSKKEDSSDEEDAESEQKSPPPASQAMDRRPIHFLKGKLVSVDCSQSPAAVLQISKGARILKLRTSDYKSLLVMGADKFSCDWKGIPASVNYRASKSGEGDLVSIQVE